MALNAQKYHKPVFADCKKITNYLAITGYKVNI